MAGKSNIFEEDLLKLIFNATPIANIADNAATAPLTVLYVSLHTADPTAAEGTNGAAANQQSTSEANYTSYARVAVNRTSVAWTVSTSAAGVTSVKPASGTFISFPQATGGSSTITHFAVGTAATGTGKILYAGTVTPSVTVTNGITPRLTDQTTITED